MKIGVPFERNPTEHRVALTPPGAKALVDAGHEVVVHSGAGLGSRFGDGEYAATGARVAYEQDEVFGRADLVVKVAALDPSEVALLREGQGVVAFHHLAAAGREQLERLHRTGATLIGLEVIEDETGDLPVLHAMSEIAGQLAVHVGMHYLETRSGGRGVLLGGATGIPPAHVVILGAGVVGTWAARTALGNGAQVTLLDSALPALRRVEETLGQRVITEASHPSSVARATSFADVLIGAVLVRGQRTPAVVTRSMVRAMRPGAVVIDVSIDQGGCIETIRPTTLADPVFMEGEVTHYAVPNMASAVARTASQALNYACLPFVRALADLGIDGALRARPGLSRGAYLLRGDAVAAGAGAALRR